jgi:sec-independent protein translocase protein TatC
MKPSSPNHALTFTEHLEELRYRLIVAIAAVIVGFLVGLALAPRGLEWMIRPLEQAGLGRHPTPPTLDFELDAEGRLQLVGGGNALDALADAEASPSPVRMVLRRAGADPEKEKSFLIGDSRRSSVIYLRPADPFLLTIKIAFLIGIMLSLPVVLRQVWLFIAPGLTGRERRWAGPVILTATVLFPLGAAFAYFLLAYAIRFFARFAVAGLEQQLDVMAYLGFALTMMLSFGVVFELPIVVLLATRVGLISVATLQRRRREIFLILLIVCAILTPTGDPITLAAMTLPLYGLFEASIVVAKLIERGGDASGDSPTERDTSTAEQAD